MKAWNYVSLLVFGGVASAMLAAACGGDDSETTGGAGGSGVTSSSSASASHSASASSSSSTGGTGGEPAGTGVCMSDVTFDPNDPMNPVFDGCLTASCCDSFTPCHADADCDACLQDSMGTGCDTNTMYQAFKTCSDTNCPSSVCMTTLGYHSPSLNACVETNCCATFNPCEADTACNACLQDSTTPGCDMLKLYTDYTTCQDTNCPGDICGTNIGFVHTYDNMATDPVYETNTCAATNCCMDLTACADPSKNGIMDMADPEVDACLLCLQEDPACMAGPVKTSATAFNDCLKAKCP